MEGIAMCQNVSVPHVSVTGHRSGVSGQTALPRLYFPVCLAEVMLMVSVHGIVDDETEYDDNADY